MPVNTINTQVNTIFSHFIEQINNKESTLIHHNQHFFNEFKAALDTISQTQMNADNQTKAFQRSEPNTSLNEVMVNLQKSSVSLQFGIQVRNKFIAAYQEIMNMTI